MTETKSEIEARIDELLRLSDGLPSDLVGIVETRIEQLRIQLKDAQENFLSSVLRSHKVICSVKQMGEKDAYGQNPATYYAMAVAAESGELLNKLVRGLRNGDDPGISKEAVISELPDIIIYSAVLAHVLDLDLTKLVNEKVEIVIQRALDGYYGGPLKK